MSNIDPTLPIYGNPTTQSVRDNFQKAHDEITALENKTAGGPFLPLAGGVLTGLLTLSGAPTLALHAATKAYADTKLALAGGTLTGLLTLSGPPTTGLHAVTKAYADAQITQVAATYLALAGGTMTGPLVLSGDAVDPLGAATKQSVDAIATVASASVLRAGDTMTGLLILSGDPAVALGAVTRQYADTKLALAGGTMTGALRLFGNPTDTTMAANKGYVDTAITTATGAFLPLTGGTLSGTTTFSSGAVFNGTVSGSAWASPPALGATTPAAGTFSALSLVTSGTAQLIVQGGVGQQKRMLFQTGTSTRWQIYQDAAAESGSNAGSNFHLLVYDDTGAALGDALTFTRSTRLITIAGDPTTALGISTKQYVDTKVGAYLPLTGGTLTGGLVQNAAAGWGIDITAPNSLRAQGNVQAWTSITLGQSTTNAGNLTYNASAGNYRRTTWQTAGVSRWTLDIFGNETGNNAGATWSLFRFDDSGANLGVVFQASRDTGLITVSGPPTATNGIATKGYVDSAVGAVTGFLPLSGGTLTGPLILAADPATALGAATRQYADLKLALTGGSMTGGIAFGSVAASSVTDLTRHIALYAAAYGFNVTGSRLNYNMTSAAQHVFLAGGTDVVAISSTGLAMKSGSLTLLADPTSALMAATKQYVDNKAPAGGPFLSLSGGTMTGALLLYADPSSALEAATRRYVDNAVSAVTGFLPLSGGVLTGPLTLSGPPTQNLHASTKAYVDTAITGVNSSLAAYLPLAGGVMSGLLTLSGPPTANLHAATKLYVDGQLTTNLANYLPIAGGTVTGALHVLSTFDSATVTTGVVTVQPSGGGGNGLTISVSTTASSPIQFSGSGSGGAVFNMPVSLVTDPTVPLGVTTKQYTDTQDALKLALAGGTMTGPLTLASDPALPLQAATKQMVDAVSSSLGNYLPISGGTVTGGLTVNGLATFQGNITQGVSTTALLGYVTTIGGTNAAAATNFAIDGNAAQAKHFWWRATGINRWRLWMSAGEVGDGSQTGADLTLLRYADDGTTQTNVMVFNRSGPQVQLPAGGASLYLSSNNAALGNYIQFHTAGIAAPSINTRSTGTRLLLYANLSATNSDYAIGVGLSHMWFSVPDTNNARYFAWYAADQEICRFTAAGSFYFGTATTSTTDQLFYQAASGVSTFINWYTGAGIRWRNTFTRNESTGNAGSDWSMTRYDDSGVSLGVALTLRRSDGLMTVGGNVNMGNVLQMGNTSSPTAANHILMYSGNVRGRRISWYTTPNLQRWFFGLTGGELNDGSNVGSDVEIGRYNDAGSYLDSCVVISRATGLMTLKGDPTTALGASTKQYSDTQDALRLALTGGTLTGPLTLAADPVSALQAVTKQYADGLASAGGYPPVTFAALPAASANAGKVYLVTDIGVGPSMWFSDGTRWRPIHPVALARSSVAIPYTGGTAEVATVTVPVPANVLGIDGGIWVKMFFSFTGSTNTKTMRVRFGNGLAGTSIFSVTNATAANVVEVTSMSFRNRGVTNAQISHLSNVGDGQVVGGNSAHATAAIDTTAAQQLTICTTLVLGTETITLERYEVLLMP